LDSDALENEKELPLRKIAQVAILRQKPMFRENRSRESEGLLEVTTPVSYQEVNGASAKPASTPNSQALQGLAGPEIFQRIEAAGQLEPS
jgi:hypothetical protein